MDVDQLREDAAAGRIDAGRLVDLIVVLQGKLEQAQQKLEQAQQELKQAQQRIGELEQQLGGPPSAKVEEPFSVRAEEQRQDKRNDKRRPRRPRIRRGRISTAEKIRLAARTEKVYPAGVPHENCRLSHTRVIWRLEDGRAVLVAYEIYRGPNNQYGLVPGALGRSEFGIEIVVTIAHLVYVVGLSFDKVCLLLKFFQDLSLRKSQVDALLNRLARLWHREFDTLCTLLANSAVVYADETSWSIKSVWAFLSEKARVLLFGVNKDGETLQKILDPATFLGLVVSDDAAVYGSFSTAQKCWAHLLRKAIKLTLLDPDNEVYRRFTDRLLEIYHQACRLQRDQRYSAEGRKAKVVDLDNDIVDLCGAMWAADLPPLEGLDHDYRLLVNELMRLMVENQLFTFVTAEPVTAPNGQTQTVSGTNNESERTIRNPAMARDTGRANKSVRGARRQTVVVSVLESLRRYLSTFTLSTVVAEIQNWATTGQSCFAALMARLKLSPPSSSVLDQVLPAPGG